MTRYELAKIVAWAECLHSRKRLQKVVYLLQVAGCPLQTDYTLHHYGPYSSELARLSDEMVQLGLLTEDAGPNAMGQQYSYRLTPQAVEQINELEATTSGREMAGRLADFELKARQLIQTDLKDLEYASTMAFFRKEGHDWPTAIEKTCAFKGLTTGTPVVQRAEQIAREVIE